MAKRLTIHPPYLVNRTKGEDATEKLKYFDQALSELHRYLRYITDANDATQKALEELQADEGDDSARLEQPIRTAAAAAEFRELTRPPAPRIHSHPHVHGPEDIRLTNTEGVLAGQIFGD